MAIIDTPRSGPPENAEAGLPYPPALLYAFGVGMMALLVSGICFALSFVLPSPRWIDAALAFMSIGGLLGYGCLTWAEGIEEAADSPKR